MNLDAIQPDVSGSDVTAVIDGAAPGATDVIDGAATEHEMVLSPRDLAMQQITQQLEEGREVVVDDGAAVNDQSAFATDQKQVLADDQLAVTMVRVKVDGQEVELPLSEVTKGYQKDSVASRRLEDAAAQRKELDARKLELDAQEQLLTAGTVVGVNDPAFRDQIKASLEALSEGDVDQAVNALAEVLTTGRQTATPQQVDTDAITAQVKSQLEHDATWENFVSSNEAFADETSKERIFGDALYTRKYLPMIEAGQISYREALTETAKEVKAAFTPAAAPPPPPLTDRQKKEIRKQSIDNLQVAVGARDVTDPPKTETAVDVLERLKGWRGQAV